MSSWESSKKNTQGMGGGGGRSGPSSINRKMKFCEVACADSLGISATYQAIYSRACSLQGKKRKGEGGLQKQNLPARSNSPR